MRVLFFAGADDIGGAACSFIEMVKTLHERYGVECAICTNTSQPTTNKALKDFCIAHVEVDYGPAMENPSINWYRTIARYTRTFLKRFNNYKACKQIERSIDMSKIDLIHINSARSDLGMQIAKRNHIKCITHIREFGKEDFNCATLRPNYIGYLNKHNNRFIAISDAVAHGWEKKGLLTEKVTTIYNGIDMTDIISANAFNSSHTLRCLIVGGVIPNKGQNQIVEAIGMLSDKVRNSVLLDIVGWGDKSYMAGIEQRINELGLQKQICLLGKRNDVHQLLKDYDVGFMCSRSEGFGRVTAEYMHAGLLVIASDTGANPELIKDGERGLLYHYGDFKDLSLKIEYAFSNPQQCKTMAERGKEFALENFTSVKNADNIYKLYCNVLKES